MTIAEAIKIFDKLNKCNTTVDCSKKSCKGCEFFVSKKKQREARDIAVKTLLQQPRVTAEFFKSGIEFAKTEFVRNLEKEKMCVGEMHRDKTISDLEYLKVLGLQRAIELAEEVRLDEGIKETNKEGGTGR